MKKNEKLSIILKGETINLCKPTANFARGDIWFKWLNNPSIIKNLSSVYKKLNNTPQKQLRYFLKEKNKRIILIISTKDDIYKGAISLSNFKKNDRSCEIALITDPKIEPHLAPFSGLEAIALMTQYAFEKIKIRQINGAGSVKLKNWQQRMELFGYKFKDLIKLKNNFDYTVNCKYEDYKIIKKGRGKYWDNLKMMKKRIRKLPKNSFQKKYIKLNLVEKSKYYDDVFKK